MEGGGGHGHGGHKQPSSDTTTPAAPPPAPVVKPPKPENQIEIVGVVKAIDPDTKRITIAYDAVDGCSGRAGRNHGVRGL